MSPTAGKARPAEEGTEVSGKTEVRGGQALQPRVFSEAVPEFREDATRISENPAAGSQGKIQLSEEKAGHRRGAAR